MRIPSLKECEDFMREFRVPENVKRHSETVGRIAGFIGKRISSNGFKVDLDCIERAALLHDLMKLHCIEHGGSHPAEAGRVLAEKGYPEFGEILKLHGLEEVLGFSNSTPLEAKILWYADKRVTHDKIVSLKERYAYLKGTYGSQSEERMGQIASTEKTAFELEKSILKMAGLEGVLGGLIG